MTIFIGLMAIIALALLCPDTPIGRVVRRHLVERPAQWLNTAEPWRIAMTIAIIVAGLAIMSLMPLLPPADMLPMIGEAPFYADLCLFALAALSGGALKLIRSLVRWGRQGLTRRIFAARQGRTRVRRPRQPPASDEDHPVPLLA